ncbi:universal stress protein [Aquimarina spongiae]|uniref:Nucleotide-binding universal stress protein, UspA family n=1 Tax=Aquimarina spongiae TaxID=570521 RepID=A0A1M6I931_9FLAO|nr:universal stress protein [Aquimarina spongiae]SHJ30994.1 Nucleotide-binding universal stress protein, UspA family [Aquimarina spongiae]
MRRVLVPTDFSNNAYSALFYATRFFQNEPCHFFILNTFDVNTPVLTSRIDTSKGDALYRQLSATSKDKLTETLHCIVRDTEDFEHTFETISVSKDLTETINKTIQSKEIDLVVMGTKGASGLKEIFIGSNAVKAIQNIKQSPILLVPDELDFKPPRQIAFATGFGRSYSKAELQPIITMAKMFKASIKVLHIHENELLNEEQEQNFKILRTLFEGVELSMHWLAKDNQKAEVIQMFLEEMNIDMLTMLRYPHSITESITHEPVVKKMGFRIDIPFLVIPVKS